MAKKPENVIDALEENTITENINTLESINKPATDEKLQREEMKKASSIVKGKRKKFKASTAFASLYPDGLTTSYQGIPINILFNNTVWEFPEAIVDYLEDKIQKKADKEAEKLHQFNTKKQELIGEYDAGE